jgi:hypothetical protein
MPKYEITRRTLERADDQFLTRYSLSINDVLDARTMDTEERIARMTDESKLLALMLLRCERCVEERRGIRHLRTKYGHCIYCNKCAITFIKNRNKDGFVYIAGSVSGGLIKIGSAECPLERQRSLNHTGYGGITDWHIIVHSNKIKAAGKIEAEIQGELRNHRSPRKWIEKGRETETLETFKCSFTDAQKVFNMRLDFGCKATRADRYEFKMINGVGVL